MRRFCQISWIATCVMSGCVAAPDLSQLSQTDAEAYAVLNDQLERLAEIPTMRQMELQLCVSVSAGREERDPPPQLLQALRAAMPRALDSTLIPMSECRNPQGIETLSPDGKPAFLLQAFFDPERNPDDGQWSAGSGCRMPCGYQDRYRIRWLNNRPVAEFVMTERARPESFWAPFVPI